MDRHRAPGGVQGSVDRGRLVEIDDAYVLSMLDQPQAVAKAMGEFLTGGQK
ncbi:hypothetical protein [Nocardia wallacei]|uniref:hypothetical protein n=1 Tax=Nocardia wallacei TaxID=480035 RepID=UPI002454127B|nr:hypothetical protein [Nocardia wallacei]